MPFDLSWTLSCFFWLFSLFFFGIVEYNTNMNYAIHLGFCELIGLMIVVVIRGYYEVCDDNVYTELAVL